MQNRAVRFQSRDWRTDVIRLGTASLTEVFDVQKWCRDLPGHVVPLPHLIRRTSLLSVYTEPMNRNPNPFCLFVTLVSHITRDYNAPFAQRLHSAHGRSKSFQTTSSASRNRPHLHCPPALALSFLSLFIVRILFGSVIRSR